MKIILQIFTMMDHSILSVIFIDKQYEKVNTIIHIFILHPVNDIIKLEVI